MTEALLAVARGGSAAPFPLAFAIAAFGVAWAGSLFFSSSMSGWRSLAPRYPYLGDPPAGALGFRSATMGRSRFNNVLRCATPAEGFYLATSVPGLLMPFHPPLLVPWKDVGRLGQRKFLWVDTEGFALGVDPPVELWLYRRTFDELKERYPHFLDRVRP